jgi:DNA-binding NtrC family response regulator
VSLIRCRSCEKIQPASSNCRRCGRSLALFDRVASPVQPSSATIVTVDKSVAAPIVDVTHTIAEIERAVIMARVEHHRGNLTAAARSLGISFMTIHRKLKTYKRCNGSQNVMGPHCGNS